MEETYCQSCGMPLQAPEHFGSNEDGSPNKEYCRHCYKEGAFSFDYTMDEMIEHCLIYINDFKKENSTEFCQEQAYAEMKELFPTLKRWAK